MGMFKATVIQMCLKLGVWGNQGAYPVVLKPAIWDTADKNQVRHIHARQMQYFQYYGSSQFETFKTTMQK